MTDRLGDGQTEGMTNDSSWFIYLDWSSHGWLITNYFATSLTVSMIDHGGRLASPKSQIFPYGPNVIIEMPEI